MNTLLSNRSYSGTVGSLQIKFHQVHREYGSWWVNLIRLVHLKLSWVVTHCGLRRLLQKVDVEFIAVINVVFSSGRASK